MSATVSYRTEFESSYFQNLELHSHRYRVEVTVTGPQRQEDRGKVIEFKRLAHYVSEVVYDKSFLIGTDSLPEERFVVDAMREIGVKYTGFSFPLSVENFCIDIANKLQKLFDRYEPGVQIYEVKLRETNDSYATWTADAAATTK